VDEHVDVEVDEEVQPVEEMKRLRRGDEELAAPYGRRLPLGEAAP
jgi:hypothetical protein